MCFTQELDCERVYSNIRDPDLPCRSTHCIPASAGYRLSLGFHTIKVPRRKMKVINSRQGRLCDARHKKGSCSGLGWSDGVTTQQVMTSLDLAGNSGAAADHQFFLLHLIR